MGLSSGDWERPQSGGIEVGDTSGEGTPNIHPAPPRGSSVVSDAGLGFAFSHLHFGVPASLLKNSIEV